MTVTRNARTIPLFAGSVHRRWLLYLALSGLPIVSLTGLGIPVMDRALSRPSVASAPTPSAVTRIEWGTRGNLEDQFLFSFVNLNHWQILSWRLDIRGGFTDQWSHHYSFIISSGVVYYIFVLSLLRVSQRWLSPTIVLQCCRRGFRRTPTNHTNGGPPSLPPLRPRVPQSQFILWSQILVLISFLIPLT